MDGPCLSAQLWLRGAPVFPLPGAPGMPAGTLSWPVRRRQKGGSEQLTVTSLVLHLPRSKDILHQPHTEGLSHEVGTRH